MTIRQSIEVCSYFWRAFVSSAITVSCRLGEIYGVTRQAPTATSRATKPAGMNLLLPCRRGRAFPRPRAAPAPANASTDRCLARFREPKAASLRLLHNALPKRDPKRSRSLPVLPGRGVRRQHLTHLPNRQAARTTGTAEPRSGARRRPRQLNRAREKGASFAVRVATARLG